LIGTVGRVACARELARRRSDNEVPAPRGAEHAAL